MGQQPRAAVVPDQAHHAVIRSQLLLREKLLLSQELGTSIVLSIPR